MSEVLSKYEQQIVDFVDSDGCFIVAVFDPQGDEPDFAYSVGFPASLGQPDIIISGLDLDIMKRLIKDTYGLCRGGLTMEEMGRTDQLLNGYDCVFRKVADEFLIHEIWNSAIWFQERYRGKSFDAAFQIVWPDKQGMFPWNTGFDDLTGGGQLALWEGATLQ